MMKSVAAGRVVPRETSIFSSLPLKEKLRLPIFGMMMALDWAGMMMQALLQALLLALKLLRHGYLLPYPISYHMKSWQ